MIDFFNRALKLYGKTGDQSFECIGVNFTSAGLEELRVYRQKSPALLAAVQKEPPYSYILGEILRPFYEKEHVHLCDISQKCLHGETAFRVIFSIPRTQTVEEAQADLLDFFACFPNSAEFKERGSEQLDKYRNSHPNYPSPLMLFGAEFDEQYRLQGIKYYMRLQDYRFLKTLDEKWSGSPEELCNRICDREYRPIFVGINDSGNSLEEKLYFTFKSTGVWRPEILEKNQALCHHMGWEHVLSHNRLKSLYDAGLYLGGLALSLQSDMWRVYFREFLSPPH